MFSAERMASDAIAAAGFGLVGIALFSMTVVAGTSASRSGWIWGLGLPALLIFGAIAFALVRRYYDRPTLLKRGTTRRRGPWSRSWAGPRRSRTSR